MNQNAIGLTNKKALPSAVSCIMCLIKNIMSLITNILAVTCLIALLFHIFRKGGSLHCNIIASLQRLNCQLAKKSFKREIVNEVWGGGNVSLWRSLISSSTITRIAQIVMLKQQQEAAFLLNSRLQNGGESDSL